MSSTPQPGPEFRPQIFGKFYLLQKVAAGGMAEIFRAKAAGAGGFEKELAVKRILPNLSADQQFVKMLVNEAKLTVALTHPTIAQIYELGEIEGVYFLSMEYVEGATLHDVLWTTQKLQRPFTIEQSIYVALEILRGLDYAHRRTDGAGNPLGIVHCDVSPDNAMVTWDGGVKLLDFGIARAATALSNYKRGTLMGKLNYVAPEQAEGDWFDHRVDTFAVGVLLYELLTGQHPFGRVKTVEELKASRKRRVVPPSEANPSLPRILDDFVVKALAHSRDQRFQTAKEMADELVDFLFPTPTLAVAEHLSVTMKDLYRERIEKQQRLRGNDGLTIKVLANGRHAAQTAAAVSAAGEQAPQAPRAMEHRPRGMSEPELSTRVFVSAFDPTGSISLPNVSGIALPERTPGRGGPKQKSDGHRASAHAGARSRLGLGLGLGAVVGMAAGAAGLAGLQALRPMPLSVFSEPAGAEVLLDGVRLGATPLSTTAKVPETGADLLLRLPEHREEQRRVSPGDHGAIALYVKLRSSLGPLRIDSEPTGATVRIDGREVGVTPLELPAVRLDESHRIDLEKRGFELDSFVVQPDGSSNGVRRVLVAKPGRR